MGKFKKLLNAEIIVSGMVAILAIRAVDKYLGGLLARVGL